MIDVDIDRLKERLRYVPESGEIFRVGDMPYRWRSLISARADVFIGEDEPRRVYFDGKLLGAHRVAWALHFGKWPELKLSHRNGNPNDNRLENLFVRGRKPRVLHPDGKNGFLQNISRERVLKSFNAKLIPEPNSGCWLWEAAINYTGYGVMHVGGRDGYNYLASRISMFLFHEDFDLELCALHKCDNPLCVNPDHLFSGTRLDNHRDMVKKGRHPSSGKLTAEAISFIKNYPSERGSGVFLAKKFGVSHARISAIVNGK